MHLNHFILFLLFPYHIILYHSTPSHYPPPHSTSLFWNSNYSDRLSTHKSGVVQVRIFINRVCGFGRSSRISYFHTYGNGFFSRFFRNVGTSTSYFYNQRYVIFYSHLYSFLFLFDFSRFCVFIFLDTGFNLFFL